MRTLTLAACRWGWPKKDFSQDHTWSSQLIILSEINVKRQLSVRYVKSRQAVWPFTKGCCTLSGKQMPFKSCGETRGSRGWLWYLQTEEHYCRPAEPDSVLHDLPSLCQGSHPTLHWFSTDQKHEALNSRCASCTFLLQLVRFWNADIASRHHKVSDSGWHKQ